MTEASGADSPALRPQVPMAPGETAVGASAAQVRAEIESAYAIARAFPRQWTRVRQLIFDDCKRPLFADEAMYHLPRRKWNKETRQYEEIIITGISIRYAESAMRALGNLRIASKILFENAEQRILEVVVTDLESNNQLPGQAVIEKTQERKKLNRGQERDVIRTRVGSDGEVLFVIPVAENDLRAKQNAAASIMIRNAVIRLLPADLIEESERLIVKTSIDSVAKDPKKIDELVAGFDRLGVKKPDIELWLKKPVAKMTPEEWARLRGIGTAIKDGEESWENVMAVRQADEDEKRVGQKLSDTDAAKREELIRTCARTKIETPDIHAKALTDAGLPANTRVESLDLPTLAKVAGLMAPKNGGAS